MPRLLYTQAAQYGFYCRDCNTWINPGEIRTGVRRDYDGMWDGYCDNCTPDGQVVQKFSSGKKAALELGLVPSKTTIRSTNKKSGSRPEPTSGERQQQAGNDDGGELTCACLPSPKSCAEFTHYYSSPVKLTGRRGRSLYLRFLVSSKKIYPWKCSTIIITFYYTRLYWVYNGLCCDETRQNLNRIANGGGTVLVWHVYSVLAPLRNMGSPAYWVLFVYRRWIRMSGRRRDRLWAGVLFHRSGVSMRRIIPRVLQK